MEKEIKGGDVVFLKSSKVGRDLPLTVSRVYADKDDGTFWASCWWQSGDEIKQKHLPLLALKK